MPKDNCSPVISPTRFHRWGSLTNYIFIFAALKFFDNENYHHWWTLFATIFSIILIFIGVFWLKLYIQRNYQMDNMKELELLEENDDEKIKEMKLIMKCSLGCIVYSNAVPLVAALTIGWSPCILTYLTITCGILSQRLESEIYQRFIGIFSANYSQHGDNAFWTVLFQFFLPMMDLPYSLCVKPRDDFIAVFILQLIYTVFYAPLSVEYAVLREDEGAKLCSKEEEEPQADLDMDILGDLSCEVCHLEYHEFMDAHAPRMLHKCGHTFCEQCLVELAKLNKNEFITCPTCSVKTPVRRGTIEQFPKNYPLLYIIRKVNRDKELHLWMDTISGRSIDKEKMLGSQKLLKIV
ncbi:unnamed protein product [Caenorhabditis brenneri]